MKVPVDWLGDYVDLNGVTEDELSRALTMTGLEVEEIDDVAGARVLVTKVTPNRGDWMSVAGTAREASAALGKPFRGYALPSAFTTGTSHSRATVTVQNPEWCPRYSARVLTGIKHGLSPVHIQQRLTAAGMRPLGVVVDITNYVMLELGQPLHAFDFDKLPGGEIIVRAATDGETIKTLDGADRTLTTDNLVIADRNQAIAIAGVMGGATTEVTAETSTILLESAHFDAGVVRRTSKALGLSTEASYRFERYVDPALVAIAQDRACELFVKYAGATVEPEGIDTNPTAAKTWTVTLRPSRVNGLLGTSLTVPEVLGELGRVEIHPTEAVPGASAGDMERPITFTVPSFRPDVTREIDLVEEIGRMVGYETLPETIPAIRGAGGKDWPVAAFDSRLRRILIGQGMTEIYTHTLRSPSAFDEPAIDAARVRIRTALSAELSILRASLIPSLLEVAATNLRHRQTELRLFEVGKTYRTSSPGHFSEPRYVAGLLTGGMMDYSTAKGIVENLLAAVGAHDVTFEKASVHGMHPGRTASVHVDGNAIGFVAEIEPDMAKEHLDLPSSAGRIAVFELAGEILRSFAVESDNVEYKAPPRFPGSSRDIAMVFDLGVLYGDIERVSKESAGELLESVSLVSVYTGEKVATGKKSVAIRLTLRAAGRTLNDADVDQVVASVQQALSTQLAAEAR